MDRPARAVADDKIAHAHAGAILKADRAGARGGKRLRAEGRPPLFALSFQRAQTRQRHVDLVFRVNQRAVAGLLIALPADVHDGVCVKIIDKAQHGARFQMQFDVAAQNEARRLILARGHAHAPAALCGRRVNRALNRVAAKRPALRAEIQNVHQPRSSPFSMAVIWSMRR